MQGDSEESGKLHGYFNQVILGKSPINMGPVRKNDGVKEVRKKDNGISAIRGLIKNIYTYFKEKLKQV
jgi:hypothetical protein